MRHLLCGLWFSLVTAVVLADSWPNWRGPNGNGVADGNGYATSWSATENVAWRTTLSGPGSSTPAVWNDRIFVTCERNGMNSVVGLDRRGQLAWQVDVGTYRAGKHPKGTGCNPSPVTDGRHVYVYFKSGDLACVDYSGKIVWQHNLQDKFGEDTLWWDLGTSPVLFENLVIVACIQSGPSYVVAFDRLTGDQRWKRDRILAAPRESNQSYTTPCLARTGERAELVVLGADHLTGHDLASGVELWRAGGLNPDASPVFRSIASPVTAGNIVLAPYARGATLTAVQLGGTGDVTDSHVLWTKTGVSADVPTPTTKEGRAYVCSDRGQVTCLDVATGEEVWSQATEKSRHAFSSSPVLGEAQLYVTREDGTTFVLNAANGQSISKNELGEFVVATPVLVDGQILIRTVKRLICIGTPE
jgi:outer membrane protein assembly factor BamB